MERKRMQQPWGCDNQSDDLSIPLKSPQDASDVQWYERDKRELPGPSLFWRAIWPEGGQPQQGRVNFIAMVYLSAPTKQAAVQEFRRWADLRMQDIPCAVIEQVDVSVIPCCPFPCFEQEGEAIAGIWNHLT